MDDYLILTLSVLQYDIASYLHYFLATTTVLNHRMSFGVLFHAEN